MVSSILNTECNAHYASEISKVVLAHFYAFSCNTYWCLKKQHIYYWKFFSGTGSWNILNTLITLLSNNVNSENIAKKIWRIGQDGTSAASLAEGVSGEVHVPHTNKCFLERKFWEIYGDKRSTTPLYFNYCLIFSWLHTQLLYTVNIFNFILWTAIMIMLTVN